MVRGGRVLTHRRVGATRSWWCLGSGLLLPWGVSGGPCVLPTPRAVFCCSAIDYIQFLHKEKKKQEEEVSILRKEVMALKIMKV